MSPADGRILHFGTVTGRRVEQVKGSTYSLDALLGVETPASPPSTPVHGVHRGPAEAPLVEGEDIPRPACCP